MIRYFELVLLNPVKVCTFSAESVEEAKEKLPAYLKDLKGGWPTRVQELLDYVDFSMYIQRQRFPCVTIAGKVIVYRSLKEAIAGIRRHAAVPDIYRNSDGCFFFYGASHLGPFYETNEELTKYVHNLCP